MAPDGGSSGRAAAPEPPARGVVDRLKRYVAFARKLAAYAHGNLRSFAARRHSLGVRLLSGVLLFSGCVTLVLTLVQLYLEYRRDVSDLELRLEQINESYLDSLAAGLWTLDEKQLGLQLTGILRLPDIRAVEVREVGSAGNPFVIKLGEKSASSAITREYPLRYDVQGQNTVIGTLSVQATLAAIYGRLFDMALTILASQAAKTFLVSLFIVYIFHRLVTRHLAAMASFVGSYRIDGPLSPLRLRRPPRRREDELERVVTAFNALTNDLRVAYRRLQGTNEELARDIAARRQAEAVARKGEARIRRLIDANIIGIFIWDFEGQVLEANDAFLRIVGYDREDLVAGQIRWMELTPPEWRERDERLWIPQHRTTGRLPPIEKEYFRKDGSRVPVLIGAATFDEGENQGVAFVLDLTEQKRAERALREQAGLLDLTHDTIFVRDLQDVITYWNRGAEELYGWPREEAVGKVSHQLTKTIFPAPLEAITAELHRTGRWQGELVHAKRDGTPVVVASRWSLQRDEQGNPLAILETNNDITEHKQAEEALRESEEQWKAAFENNPTMYFMVDEAGTILSVNPFGAEQLGYGVDELVGRSVWGVFDEADRESVRRNVASCFEQLGRSMRWEVRKIRKDGAVLWVRETARATSMKKRPVVLIACEDITERRRAEAELRASERRYRYIFQAAGVSIWEEDFSKVKAAIDDLKAEGVRDFRQYLADHPEFVRQAISWVKVVDVNDVTVRLFAAASKDQLLASLDSVFAPETQEVFAGELIALAEGRTSFEAETVLRTLKGERLTVLFTIRFPTQPDRFDSVLVTVMDITERKRAEVLTRQMMESSPDGMAVVGRDYRYRRANRVYARDWRTPAERIVGMRVADVLGTEIFEQTVKPKLDRCFAGEEVRYTHWFPDARGRSYIAVSYSPLRLGSKVVEAALVIGHDLTEHVLAAEALREAQMKLAHVNRVTTMGQLTASIAHEVNQPIAAAVTNAQAAVRWLAAHPPDLDEARRALDRIVRDGTRAGEVISRIRNLVRKGAPQRDQVDVNETILEVVALTRREAERHGIALQTRLARDLPRVWGDRIQLQQVILNLLTNAVDALRGTDNGPRELLVGSGRDDAGGVLVSVRDSGPGLDPEGLDLLFEAFHTTKPDGLGMGLAISRSIVEAHGGRLWATPNAPRGAVLQFTLPLAAGEASSAEHTQSAA